MNIERERAAFEVWAASIGLTVTGWRAESLSVLCAESAFKAGYRAAQAAMQLQDREDAERYRWLRDPCSGAENVIFYSRGDYGKGLMSGEMLDEAIDNARCAKS